MEIIKILKKNDLKKCSFMRRIFYPVKFHPDIAPHKSLLFPRATSQVSMLAWILGDCREALQRCKFDASLLAAGYLIVLRCMVRSD